MSPLDAVNPLGDSFARNTADDIVRERAPTPDAPRDVERDAVGQLAGWLAEASVLCSATPREEQWYRFLARYALARLVPAEPTGDDTPGPTDTEEG